jgi:predicted dehydrogenase
MKIGLIGAQNSHSRHFCEAINKNKKFDDAIISYIYGEDDPAECKRLCEDYGITECLSEEEVIEKSDAVVITYRKGSIHYKPAINALKAGKPLFNDKPFAADLREAEEIVSLAKQQGVPLTGGSNLKSLSGLEEIKKEIIPGSVTVISFAADPASEYDGYWFYGIHAVEVCLEICGFDFISVESFKSNNVVVTNVAYSDKTCVLVTAPQMNDLVISTSNGGKTICRNIPMNYEDVGPGELVDMAKTGKPPRDYAHYVKAVELTGKIIETAGLTQEN